MESWITDWTPSERLPHYTRANAGEVLPDPASPLGWTLVFEQGLVKGWRQGFIDFGTYRPSELDEDQPGCVGMFGGYFYLSLSGMRLMTIRMGGTVEDVDRAFLGSHPDAPPHQAHPDDECAECAEKIAGTMGWIFTTPDYPEVDADTERALAARRGRPDLATLSDAELVARMRSFLPELDTGFYRHDYTSLASTVGPGMLAGTCAAVGRPELLLELISGLGDVPSAQSSTGLWALSRSVSESRALGSLFDQGIEAVSWALAEGQDPEVAAFGKELDAFLADFGFRGPNEWDIHSPAWETKPELVLGLLDKMRRSSDDDSPAIRHDRLVGAREAAAAEVRRLLGDDAEQLGAFDNALRMAALFIPARERTKANCVIFIHEVRLCALELGRRAVAAGVCSSPGDVDMLLADELDAYVADPASFADVIAERLEGYRALFDLEPPFIFSAENLPLSTWKRRGEATSAAPRAAAGDSLSGVAGAPGVHTGRVRIVHDPADVDVLEPGDVLVAPLTDQAWTPLFLVAGAVVVDVGAMNSHAVVVCRELGIPCVASVTGATGRLLDGDTVEVDGSAGTIRVVASAP